ncbi:hypothetical protein EDD90_2816 [Streptomyces sp. Ag109_O5-1]|nr:hypothetical protein [Streptomyces sp. Ag109_O5-1]RPE39798.1 hypothetical protein EDD90_2816 [Streptomyces sp. Ag109_O5-1]
MPNSPAHIHQAALVLSRQHRSATRNPSGSCTAPGYATSPDQVRA